MSKELSRRSLFLAGAALAASGCGRRSPDSYALGPAPASTLYVGSSPKYGLWYNVASGDTLSSIKRRSGLSIAQIIEANRLSSSQLAIGQRLWLPGVRSLSLDPLVEEQKKIDDALPGWDGTSYSTIKRGQWTKNSLRSNRRAMGSVRRLTVHHTGEHGNWSHMADVDVVRSIENYHRNERKWACIGYHYLIGRDGRVYEGRPVAYQGAHTRNANKGAIGISMIGDFNDTRPQGKQIKVLARFLNDLMKRYNLKKSNIFGHRDLSPSECPGKHLYAWLKKFKAS